MALCHDVDVLLFLTVLPFLDDVFVQFDVRCAQNQVVVEEFLARIYMVNDGQPVDFSRSCPVFVHEELCLLVVVQVLEFEVS